MSISYEGTVRELKRKTLSLMHNVQARVERMRLEPLLENYDPEPIVNNQPTKKIKSIMFIITRLVRFSGGQTSILRLGTQLSRQGYKVYYAVYKPQSRTEMIYCASANLKDYQGTTVTAKEMKRMYRSIDAVVATSWDTVSYAKKFYGYKMYFVQDYEPYFYMYGEQSLMAEKTYEQGLHMVSLGEWNKDMILKHCKTTSPIDVISFPYERSEYPEVCRDYDSYSDKKELTLAVYLKYYGKRLPCMIQWMIKKLKEELIRDGISLKVYYFGEAKTFKVHSGVNLGMLSKEELYNLYKHADFGMVASYSNISLVPYEMLATGLPLIEIEDGTFPYFFKEDSAILTSISYKDLYKKLKEALRTPEIMKTRNRNAQKTMEALSWERTGREMKDIITKLESR